MDGEPGVTAAIVPPAGVAADAGNTSTESATVAGAVAVAMARLAEHAGDLSTPYLGDQMPLPQIVTAGNTPLERPAPAGGPDFSPGAGLAAGRVE